MKFKVIAVIVVATALCLGMARSAGASPLSHDAKPAPQVTGARLQSALLPASAFGGGFVVFQRLNSGNQLWSTHAVIRPSSLSCVGFETYTYVRGFGNTAGATDSVNNPSPDFSTYPDLVLGGDQAALQFGSSQAAASFYNRAYARYNQCSSFTESFPADHLTLDLATQTLSTTTIGQNRAFQLVQLVSIGSIAQPFYQNTAVVLAGTNIYTVDDVNATNDQIPTSLLSELISRVQALYKHH